MVKKVKKSNKTRNWRRDLFLLTIVGIVLALISTSLYWGAIRPYYVKKQRTEITHDRMGRAFDWLLDQAEKAKAFPPPKPTQFQIRTNPNGTGYDGWSKAMRYRHMRDHVEIRSAGPDGELFNEDDIVLTSKDRPASFGVYQETEQ